MFTDNNAPICGMSEYDSYWKIFQGRKWPFCDLVALHLLLSCKSMQFYAKNKCVLETRQVQKIPMLLSNLFQHH